MERHRPTGRAWLGFGYAAATMLLWGVLPLALGVVLESLDAATVTFVRFTLAAAVLGAWLAARGRLPALGRLGRTGWALLAVATLGLAANYVGYLVGLGRTSPANAAVLSQAAPLLLALGGVFVFREHFTRLQWLGFLVLVVGIGVFFGGQLRALAADAARYREGAAILVVASLVWAVYGLAQKQLLRALPAQALMLLIYAGCALCLLPLSSPAGVLLLEPLPAALLLFCAANTLLAYGAFAAALEHWEASRVSAVISLTPLATVAAGLLAEVAFPGFAPQEQMDAQSILGALLVVAGSLATSLGGRSD